MTTTCPFCGSEEPEGRDGFQREPENQPICHHHIANYEMPHGYLYINEIFECWFLEVLWREIAKKGREVKYLVTCVERKSLPEPKFLLKHLPGTRIEGESFAPSIFEGIDGFEGVASLEVLDSFNCYFSFKQVFYKNMSESNYVRKFTQSYEEIDIYSTKSDL
jgi:hypothetical protein